MNHLREESYILRIKLVQDPKNRMIALSHATYNNNFLSYFTKENYKTCFLPFNHGVELSKEKSLKTPQEVEGMRKIPCASTIKSLMYVMLCTWLDICFTVGIVSRYQLNLGEQHWVFVKHILKYLRRMRDYMLVYTYDDL